MSTLLIYGLVALAVLGTLGGVAYKLDRNGFERGTAEVTVKWDAANAAAQKKVDADRARQDALRQAQDVQATKRLSDAQKRSRTLMASLDSHIKAAGLRSDCRISDLLLNDANNAITAGQGVGPSAVPAKPGAVAPTR